MHYITELKMLPFFLNYPTFGVKNKKEHVKNTAKIGRIRKCEIVLAEVQRCRLVKHSKTSTTPVASLMEYPCKIISIYSNGA